VIFFIKMPAGCKFIIKVGFGYKVFYVREWLNNKWYFIV